MQQVTFQPKTDVQDFLNNAFNYEIYCALTESEKWKNIIDPLAFFNLLYEHFEWILGNLSKPLDIQKGLIDLKLADNVYYFLLDCLLKLIFAEADPEVASAQITSRLFRDSYELLDAAAKFYVHDEFRSLSNDTHNQRKKRLFLIFTIIDKEQARIKKESTVPLPSPVDRHFEEETFSDLKLAERQGVKSNVMRILSAMYELNLIETQDGSDLTKDKFMTLFANFLSDDFSDQLLSQALKASQESHLAVFEKLNSKAKSQWEEALERKNKNQTTNKQGITKK